jgi:hypothetical protein
VPGKTVESAEIIFKDLLANQAALTAQGSAHKCHFEAKFGPLALTRAPEVCMRMAKPALKVCQKWPHSIKPQKRAWLRYDGDRSAAFQCQSCKYSRIARDHLRTVWNQVFQRVLSLETQMSEAIESCVNHYGNLKQSQGKD